ncbi:MAG: hypothetical protein KJO98_08695, partial [Rhodothermia bacterium]|nr:hypothetical protein [Rhodothermia bacterium]
MKSAKRVRMVALPVLAMLFAVGPVYAQSDTARIDELERQAAMMAEQLAELRAELETAKKEESSAGMHSMREETVAARQAAQRAEQAASEWKNTTAVTHLAGYASADFISPENGEAAFVANFNPMFHFQYNDKILWEAELEIEVEENGDTSIGLEYSTIDWFLNDSMILIAGKFLSPL